MFNTHLQTQGGNAINFSLDSKWSFWWVWRSKNIDSLLCRRDDIERRVVKQQVYVIQWSDHQLLYIYTWLFHGTHHYELFELRFNLIITMNCHHKVLVNINIVLSPTQPYQFRSSMSGARYSASMLERAQQFVSCYTMGTWDQGVSQQ